MTRINVFEGSRRIALVLKVVWLIGVAVVASVHSAPVSMTFVTSQPNAPFIITDEDCDTSSDAVEFVTRAIDNHRSISARLCFKSQAFEPNQQRLVPYRIDNDTVWGNSPYSREVTAYTDARAEEFRLTPADQERARAAWNAQRARSIWYAVLFAAGGWIGLSLLQALIGWIVRGFVGVPRGHDHIPESGPQSTGMSAAS